MVLNDKTGVQSVSYCKDNLYIFARDWSAPKSFIYKALQFAFHFHQKLYKRIYYP